jgi:hypothetical protein
MLASFPPDELNVNPALDFVKGLIRVRMELALRSIGLADRLPLAGLDLRDGDAVAEMDFLDVRHGVSSR